MPPLPVIGGDALIAALAKIGYLPSRQKGSHVRLLAAQRPPLTVPLHKTPDRGTLRAIIRAAALTLAEFLTLLD